MTSDQQPVRRAPFQDFDTARLSVCHWSADLQDAARRDALEAELAAILTPPVLAPLPEPLWLEANGAGISAWVTARAGESDVYALKQRSDGALAGLLIVAPAQPEIAPLDLHIGYLFAQAVWGRGLATELLSGLTARTEHGKKRLIAGAARSNAASIRVLQKAGFVSSPKRSSPDTAVFVHERG